MATRFNLRLKSTFEQKTHTQETKHLTLPLPSSQAFLLSKVNFVFNKRRRRKRIRRKVDESVWRNALKNRKENVLCGLMSSVGMKRLRFSAQRRLKTYVYAFTRDEDISGIFCFL